MKMRYDLINALIRKHQYKRYLEIGHRDGNCFGRIKCDYKTSVDPMKSINPKIPCDNQMTSDDFFLKNTNKFDIIFIDGLHHHDQVDKDLDNAFACLNERGTVVMHDCNPPDKGSQIIPQQQSHWNGDVWKAFVFRGTHGYINSMCVVDIDEGCGVLTGDNELNTGYENVSIEEIENTDFTWEELQKNKQKWLNLISYADYFNA